VASGEALEVVPDPGRAGHSTEERHLRGGELRLDQDLDVLTHRVVEAREYPGPALPLVGEMGHVRLEDDGTPTAQRSRLDGGAREAVCVGQVQVEALDELPKEVARPLAAPGVLAEDLVVLAAELEHGESVASDGDDRGRPLMAGELPVACGLSLLGRHPEQVHSTGEPPRHGGTCDGIPVPGGELLEERVARLLPVLDDTATPFDRAPTLDQELGDLDGLRADIDTHETLAHEELPTPQTRLTCQSWLGGHAGIVNEKESAPGTPPAHFLASTRIS